MFSWLGHTYTDRIGEPGKAGFFWLLIGFIGGFGVIRLSTRLIRADVRWWPSNVTAGGLHLHHVLFGVAFLLLTGGLLIGLEPASPLREVLAVVFGVGGGLVVDEFALLLFLDDVYWRDEGRLSIDAVLLIVALLLLVLLGLHPIGSNVSAAEGTARWIAFGQVLLTAPLVIVTVLKGKVYTAVVGLFVTPLAMVGALRLAKPGSPWARRRYASRPLRRERSARRFPDDRLRLRVRRRLQDLIGGAPTKA